MKLRPLADRVVLKKIEAEETTARRELKLCSQITLVKYSMPLEKLRTPKQSAKYSETKQSNKLQGVLIKDNKEVEVEVLAKRIGH